MSPEDIGLFRIRLPDGVTRLATGDPAEGPRTLLPEEISLDVMLSGSSSSFAEAVERASGAGPIPEGSTIAAPIESQEVWAAGVTYLRSRDARRRESGAEETAYDRVYDADRPELFFKAPGWRVRGTGEPIGVRRDSSWNAPEPELALVVAADLTVAGLSIGNDVSSRSIEGENTLYLPQAKLYEGSCSLGPCVVSIGRLPRALAVRMTVLRDGAVVTEGGTSTDRMKRTFDELVSFLGRALRFPTGVVLLTGTGIVPPDRFNLQPDDVVRIEIDGLGVLENPVVAVGET
jgi:2-dehydro-3-deoxy-D-arabinonate dehydratase